MGDQKNDDDDILHLLFVSDVYPNQSIPVMVMVSKRSVMLLMWHVPISVRTQDGSSGDSVALGLTHGKAMLISIYPSRLHLRSILGHLLVLPSQVNQSLGCLLA